jgi:hypothetical protein
MLALRPSLLLCRAWEWPSTRSAPVTRETYERRICWIALALADALFLGMFISVAQLDAQGAALTAQGHLDIGARILVFAADWRHGMNGHSPLFMPGFFALTPAVWYWSQKQSVEELLRRGALALLAGFLLALIAAPLGRAAADAAFVDQFHFAIQPNVGHTWQAVPISAFTAVCWTVLIVAVRKATTTGSTRPLVLVVGLYAVLGFTRHWWSVDHFREGNDVARWLSRIAQDDRVAIGSVLAMALLGLLFAKTTPTGPGEARLTSVSPCTPGNAGDRRRCRVRVGLLLNVLWSA